MVLAVFLQRGFRYGNDIGGSISEFIAFWVFAGLICGFYLLVSWSNEKLTGAKRKREIRQREEAQRIEDLEQYWYRHLDFDGDLLDEDPMGKRQREEAQQRRKDEKESWDRLLDFDEDKPN